MLELTNQLSAEGTETHTQIIPYLLILHSTHKISPLPLSIFKAPSILPLWRKNSVAIVTSWQRDTLFSFPISPSRVMNSMCSLNITLTSFTPWAHARHIVHTAVSQRFTAVQNASTIRTHSHLIPISCPVVPEDQRDSNSPQDGFYHVIGQDLLTYWQKQTWQST